MTNTLDFISKKYKLNLKSAQPIEIENIDRNSLAKLFAELGFTNGAEIGVERGIYSEVLLKENPSLLLYSIDPWLASAYEPGISGVDTEQKKFDDIYDEATKRLANYNSKIIRKQSLEAVKDFEDGSLDFVYIDGNHEFPNVTDDIHAWKKKVKAGGIVAGHDYCFFPQKKRNHVRWALDAYVRAYGITPYFIVGTKEIKPGMLRDRFRSWFFVNT